MSVPLCARRGLDPDQRPAFFRSPYWRKLRGDPDAIYALLSASLDLQARWLGWISRQGRVVMSAQSVAPAPKRRSF